MKQASERVIIIGLGWVSSTVTEWGQYPRGGFDPKTLKSQPLTNELHPAAGSLSLICGPWSILVKMVTNHDQESQIQTVLLVIEPS